MRPKYILRCPESTGDVPCVLGIIFNKNGEDGGLLTIGGPLRFKEMAEEIVTDYFDVEAGLEGGDVKEEGRRFRAYVEVEGNDIWETALRILERNFFVEPVGRFGRLMR